MLQVILESNELIQLLGGERVFPHGHIHGRCQNQWLLELPSADDTGQCIVTQPVGEFGQGMCGQWCNDTQGRPVTQHNMLHGVSHLIPYAPFISAVFECYRNTDDAALDDKSLIYIYIVQHGFNGDTYNTLGFLTWRLLHRRRHGLVVEVQRLRVPAYP